MSSKEACTSARSRTSKFVPITYDPIHHGYYPLGQRVGNAFADGAKLK